MRLRHYSLALLGLFSLLALSRAQAQVTTAPPLMNFQGRLTQPNGAPVADGTYAITFSLYDALTGGNQIWTQTVNPVTVHGGVFAVLLTVNTPHLFDADRWLEVQLGTDPPLSPRQQLVSVAFAMKANTVPDGSIGTNQLANGSITSNKFATNLLNPLAWLLGGNSGTNPASQFLGTTDNQPLVFRTNNLERMRMDAAGHLGIGTITPGATLHVNSPAGVGVFAGDLAPFGAAPFETNLAAPRTHIWLAENGTRVFSVTGGGLGYFAGKVGIGTASPGAQLDVAGTAQMTGFKLSTGAGANKYLASDASGNGTWTAFPTALPPNGSAGGDLSGTYPNPTVAANAVTSSKLASDAASLLKVSGGAMSILGSNVGIGTTTPGFSLNFANTLGDKIALYGNTGAHFGFGIQSNLLEIHTDTGNADIVFGYGSSASFTETARVKGTGEFIAKVVTITGGADVAEPYEVADAGAVKPLPGYVVSIDPDHIGQMRVASHAYDTTVAGIISGANGIAPGITLRHKGTIADGTLPVASIGRVWCWCDADAGGPIVAGDMLTTSDTPGHAMKAADRERRDGAVIGKAMSGLKSGKGLVLVLVSLK